MTAIASPDHDPNPISMPRERAYVGAISISFPPQRFCIRVCVLTNEGTTCAVITQPAEFFKQPQVASYLAQEGILRDCPTVSNHAAALQMIHAIDGRHTIIHSSDTGLEVIDLLTEELANSLNPPTISDTWLTPSDDSPVMAEGRAISKCIALKTSYEKALKDSERSPIPHSVSARLDQDGQIQSISISGPFLTETWEGAPAIQLSAYGLIEWKNHISLEFAKGPKGDAARKLLCDMDITDHLGTIL